MNQTHGTETDEQSPYYDAAKALGGPILENLPAASGIIFEKFAGASRERRHAFLAAMDLGAADRVPDQVLDGDRRLRRTFLTVANDASPSLIPLFSRLGAEPLRPGEYRRLDAALKVGPRWGRALCQHRNLTRDQILVATELGPDLADPRMIEKVTTPGDAIKVRLLFNLAVRGGECPRNLASSLFASTSEESVDRVLIKAVTPKQLRLGPYAGDDTLRSVRTVTELRSLGPQFRNCLNYQGDGYARNGAAFYVYDGNEPAVVCVRRDRFGWHIEELKGVANAKVSPPVRELILSKLALAGVEDRPGLARLCRTLSFGCDDHDDD